MGQSVGSQRVGHNLLSNSSRSLSSQTHFPPGEGILYLWPQISEISPSLRTAWSTSCIPLVTTASQAAAGHHAPPGRGLMPEWSVALSSGPAGAQPDLSLWPWLADGCAVAAPASRQPAASELFSAQLFVKRPLSFSY